MNKVHLLQGPVIRGLQDNVRDATITRTTFGSPIDDTDDGMVLLASIESWCRVIWRCKGDVLL